MRKKGEEEKTEEAFKKIQEQYATLFLIFTLKIRTIASACYCNGIFGGGVPAPQE